ncbi:MAG: glycoside hydrolase family 5 protein [Clostridiales bacterium]|jgi:hypothetical protein|nr:glycoside hydrolase family 5 protein [Clostridiales bacterium]
MFELCDRSLVSGFLDTNSGRIVNGDGKPIILAGWNIGNWLLPEGYMWLSGEGNRFDRPRRIEQVIRELAGSEYAAGFWKKFRDRFITEKDIAHIAELGFNSIRIPINWRVILKDEPGIQWEEDGFKLIEQCLDWCEKHRLYAFLDLHGAPGGQTGANIDDSVDDLPRLFIDEDSWEKGIEIWRELARRFGDRWIVGGYDLLNEPLKPGLGDDMSLNPYLSKLCEFYAESAKAIREIDKKHLLTIEGSNWATNTNVFCQKYDEKVIQHFHRYAVVPSVESFRCYQEVAEGFGEPLWLGESGENKAEWFAALYPLSVSLGIGYCMWTWKRMEGDCSALSVAKPEGWDEIIGYTHGGKKPDYRKVQKILDTYLDNMLFESCKENEVISNSALRRPGFTLRATDFDLEGHSNAYDKGNPFGYQVHSGMELVMSPIAGETKKGFGFDSAWDMFSLRLSKGEFASYTVNSKERFFFSIEAEGEAELAVRFQSSDQKVLIGKEGRTSKLEFDPGMGPLRIEAVSGSALLHRLIFGKA